MIKEKWAGREIYALKNDEFALSFIAKTRSDAFFVDKTFKLAGLKMRREVILIKQSTFYKKRTIYTTPAFLKIVSVAELDFCLNFLRKNGVGSDERTFSAVKTTLNIALKAIELNASKKEHFYLLENLEKN